MIFLTQLINMFNRDEREMFIKLMDDLSFEREEMGYEGMESELIADLLLNHLGYELEDEWQLGQLTEYIIKNQGQLRRKVRGITLMLGKDVA